jgi:flagellar biosynthesis regulator FlaF
MTKPKRPKTKKLTVPKLKEIYGKKAPDYARRPKRADVLKRMTEEAEAASWWRAETSSSDGAEARGMTKRKPPKTKKYTLPKLPEIYGGTAPEYIRRPKTRKDELYSERLALVDEVVAQYDDIDRSIAERTAKSKNFPALVDDAQKRAQQFNDQQRIAEDSFELRYLEELTRLQRKKIKELKQSVKVLLAHAEGTKKATATQIERARWRLEH